MCLRDLVVLCCALSSCRALVCLPPPLPPGLPHSAQVSALAVPPCADRLPSYLPACPPACLPYTHLPRSLPLL